MTVFLIKMLEIFIGSMVAFLVASILGLTPGSSATLAILCLSLFSFDLLPWLYLDSPQGRKL